ncbi:Antenna complex alpha/beta subunit [Thioflavicoccus mobilis 8321]|uniref:Antenna complex alpha/beta subunit n=1 Tax=Thioflavicoccus mobilis 8321 TaxID=765912 RepID=L0H0D1_9GAMM|nr:light-harvesting antenna LH1, alpha subunit [Thioflavicoccus mobilis]AGA91681.1 Antenna complex alpha/beta subunit [Thioflavicoccus mobilis 8321]
MYKLWQILDPRGILLLIAVFQVAIGLLIHILLLSTVDLNWWEDGRPSPLKAAAAYERSQAGLPY